MKKLVLFFLAATLVFSCQKDDEVSAPQKQDVVFSISNINFGSGLKSANVEDPTAPPECPTDENGNLLEPAYASIWISVGGSAAVEYTPAVYRLDGNLYTQAIKLEVNEDAATTYTVEDFVLLAADGTTVIMATPAEGSDYAVYVETTVDFTFNLNAFEKNEVAVDVLCYMPQDYDHFGFTWFNITEIAVREFCFFGDICLNGAPFTPADFEGSLYGTDLPVDVPAIMKIIVKRNGTEVPNSPFKNVDAQTGEPLCVQYPDRLNVPGEVFTFELQLWLPDGNGFSYQTYATYTATDDGALNIDDVGNDGVVDVVVGSCGYEGADDTFDFLYPLVCDPNFGFEQNTYGWFDVNTTDPQWVGTVSRVSSGTNGITAKEGSWFALMEGDNNLNAPFTRFCAYRTEWPGEYTVETYIYLDPAWNDYEGFEWGVASNKNDGTHLRDFVFHVSKDQSTGKLLVAGSNNANIQNGVRSTRQDLENLNHYEVTTAGWYRFEHIFWNDGGFLAVDLNLYASGGTTPLLTETRSNPGDIITGSGAIVGGHRYGWFTLINVDGGIAVDGITLNE